MSHEPVPENLESEWNAAVAADATLIHAISRLQAAPGLAPLLSRKLLSVRTCGDAVRLLARLDSQYLIQLLPEVVRLALTSHRDALRTRELIGRLPHEEIKKRIPPIVESRLPAAEDDEYRRAAELLAHLGLDRALSQLVRTALNSKDNHIRDVGADFRREVDG